MSDELFLERLAKWETIPVSPETQAEKCEALCLIFLGANPEQRSQLSGLVSPEYELTFYDRLQEWISLRRASESVIWDLMLYPREVVQHIKTPVDIQYLRIGLAAVAIVGEGIDPRDVIVSLAFLHLAAGEAGIDPVPCFREIADMSTPDIRSFMLDFLNRSADDIKSMVAAFSAY